MKSFWFRLGLVGAAGGLVSWLYSVTIGTPMTVAPLVAVAACVVFGVTATFFGVFLANTSQQPLSRALLFGLICGFCWRPVLEAGAEYVKRLPQVKLEARAEADSRALTGAVAGMTRTDPAARVRAAEHVLTAAEILVGTAGQLKDVDARKRYEQQVLLAQEAIRASRVPPSEVTARVTSDLATTAARGGFTEVAVGAITELEAQRIAAPPPAGRTPRAIDGIVDRTHLSVSKIARESNNRSLEMALVARERPTLPPV